MEVQVCIFPQLSVAVIVIKLLPTINAVPETGDCVFVTTPPEHVVVAVEEIVKSGTVV